jgi:hypothetical protein
MKITGSASVLPSSERYEEIPLHNRLQHDVASSTSPGKNRMELEYDVIGGGRLSRSRVAEEFQSLSSVSSSRPLSIVQLIGRRFGFFGEIPREWVW